MSTFLWLLVTYFQKSTAYAVNLLSYELRRYAQLLDENRSLKVAQQLTCNVKMRLNSDKMAPANLLQSKFCEGDHAKTA